MANIVHLNYVRSYPIWFAREKQVLVLKYILLKLSNDNKLTLLMITVFFVLFQGVLKQKDTR